MRIKEFSSFTTTTIGFLLVAGVLILLASWPQLTGHRLNGDACGHPPPHSHGAYGDERDCEMYGRGSEDRPDWCC
jgi:hypothetical protein